MRGTVSLALACVLSLSACASGYFSWSNARQVRVGMTEAQVTEILGPPHTVKATPQEVLLVWVQLHGLFGRVDTLSIPFRDGRVSETPQIPETFK
jgi:hypothetical protein